jgi:hypothetical protein
MAERLRLGVADAMAARQEGSWAQMQQQVESKEARPALGSMSTRRVHWLVHWGSIRLRTRTNILPLT